MDHHPSILSHVSIGTNDFKRAIAFYDAVLPTSGCKRLMEYPDAIAYATFGYHFRCLTFTQPTENLKMDHHPSILSHVSIGTNDFKRAIAFYDAVLPTSGCKRLMEYPDAIAYATFGYHFRCLTFTQPTENLKMDHHPSILSHISIGTNDFKRAIAFYDAVLPTSGCKRLMEYPDAIAYGKQYPEFWVQTPFNGQTATVGNGTHSKRYGSYALLRSENTLPIAQHEE